jgi:hypothetical protein
MVSDEMVTEKLKPYRIWMPSSSGPLVIGSGLKAESVLPTWMKPETWLPLRAMLSTPCSSSGSSSSSCAKLSASNCHACGGEAVMLLAVTSQSYGYGAASR